MNVPFPDSGEYIDGVRRNKQTTETKGQGNEDQARDQGSGEWVEVRVRTRVHGHEEFDSDRDRQQLPSQWPFDHRSEHLRALKRFAMGIEVGWFRWIRTCEPNPDG